MLSKDSVHAYGFPLECSFWWVLRCVLQVKALSHSVHVYQGLVGTCLAVMKHSPRADVSRIPPDKTNNSNVHKNTHIPDTVHACANMLSPRYCIQIHTLQPHVHLILYMHRATTQTHPLFQPCMHTHTNTQIQILCTLCTVSVYEDVCC
ncbi:hypothetical protein FKM82_030020 [Ascaphus truei]